jgi:predicted nucleic acid-binding protein
VDANIAVKWVIKEHDSSTALALLANWSKNEVIVLAPILCASEVTNILYRSAIKGDLPFHDAQIGPESIVFPTISFDLTHILTSAFFISAMKLAGQFNLPAAYDAHYLALAEREGCEFWTADERLYNSVKDKLPWVRWIADYDPATASA